MNRHFEPATPHEPSPDPLAALRELPLDTLEEAGGELFRRITVAMRDIGELRADEQDENRRSPRQRVAALAVRTELAAQHLLAVAAGTKPANVRLDRHPAAVSALMYGAPTLGGMLQRLEQDRRMLASAARGLEHRLDDASDSGTDDGAPTLRDVLTDASIVAPAECARALELQLARWDEAERARFEAERQADL